MFNSMKTPSTDYTGQAGPWGEAYRVHAILITWEWLETSGMMLDKTELDDEAVWNGVCAS